MSRHHHYISGELVAEILFRLPVKSILQCTSICKSWYSLIKSPFFINNYLSRSLSSSHINNPQLLLFCFDDYSKQAYQYSLPSTDEKFPKEYIPTQLKFNFKWFTFVGSCNGLVCFFDRFSYATILWNPSIHKTLALPKPCFYVPDNLMFREWQADCIVGIGFDSSTNDYKVLRMTASNAEIYSLNENSSKNITHIAPKYPLNSFVIPAFANGALHWIATNSSERRNLVALFDIKDETFREITLADSLEKISTAPFSVVEFAFEGSSSIAVIRGSEKPEIWVMEEYGVVGSWVKLKKNPIIDCRRSCRRCFGRSATMLGFRNNKERLFAFLCGQIVSYEPENRQIKKIIKYEMGNGKVDFFVYNYVESLALLDKGNEIETIKRRIWKNRIQVINVMQSKV